MKKINPLFPCFRWTGFAIMYLLLSGWTHPQLDEQTAKAKVEQFLELLKTHQYDKMKDFYSASFEESEPMDVKTQKLKNIESISGEVLTYEYISSERKEVDNETILYLKYKVKCSKLTLTETFGLIMEEGKYKITNHEITNQ